MSTNAIANPTIDPAATQVNRTVTVKLTIADPGKNLVQSTRYSTATEPVYLVPRDVYAVFVDDQPQEIEITGPIWYEGETRDVDTYANYRNRKGDNVIGRIVSPCILHLLKVAKQAAGIS